MKIAIIISKKDTAGMNINAHLKDLPDYVSIHLQDNESINCEELDRNIRADLFIFATKHKSATSIPSLSVHTQGNWNIAEYGGKDHTLAPSPALYLKEALKELEKVNPGGFEIIQECTHHGPDIGKPSMFIEIGSTEVEWILDKPAVIIAKVIKHLCETKPKICRTAIGIGGPHHTPNFKKIQLEQDIAIGHVCPKYMLEHLTKELIQQALEKTNPKADLILLDWKGLGEHKESIKQMCDELKIETKKTQDF
ncbi:MAG: D-aminoacyl-tRNA deacylase [Candidatus Woesearchaeota archaeon]